MLWHFPRVFPPQTVNAALISEIVDLNLIVANLWRMAGVTDQCRKSINASCAGEFFCVIFMGCYAKENFKPGLRPRAITNPTSPRNCNPLAHFTAGRENKKD